MKYTAEITEDYDGEAVRSAQFDDYDEATEWVKANGREMTRHYQDQWWCNVPYTNRFAVIIDFGSHRYFGRIKENDDGDADGAASAAKVVAR